MTGWVTLLASTTVAVQAKLTVPGAVVTRVKLSTLPLAVAATPIVWPMVMKAVWVAGSTLRGIRKGLGPKTPGSGSTG